MSEGVEAGGVPAQGHRVSPLRAVTILQIVNAICRAGRSVWGRTRGWRGSCDAPGSAPSSPWIEPLGNDWIQSKSEKLFVFRAHLSLMVTFCSAPLYSLPLH
jgi:hypothetical protein